MASKHNPSTLRRTAGITDPTEALIAALMGNRQPGSRLVDQYPTAAKFLPAVGVTEWQATTKLAEAIEGYRFVVVESGHGVGKSISAAALAVWWLEKYGPPAAVVTLAPTYAQVNGVLWRYIRGIAQKHNLSGTVYDTPRWDIEPDWHAIGLSPRKDSVEALQSLHGYHNPNLLVIMDEAPGLPRPLWDAVRGLVTGENNKILALGNPLEQAGPFWEACNSPSWHRLHISCLDHPNVKQRREVIPGATSWQWVDGMVRDHCLRCDPGEPGAIEWPAGSKQYWLPGAVFRTRVLGQAPEAGSDQLISLRWLMHAASNEAEAIGRPVIGLDPARYGGDNAAMVCRAGPKVLWVKKRKPISANPSAELAGWLKDELFAIQGYRAYIDEIGIGAGVLDKARELGLPAMGVGFGRAANDGSRFANLRAEAYWNVRDWLAAGDVDLPDDDLLIGDLAAPKFWYDAQGRIQLEPKDKIRERLNRSPDCGDALALTFSLPEQTPLDRQQFEVLIKGQGSSWIHRREKRRPSRWRR